jgi:hypothetical protein
MVADLDPRNDLDGTTTAWLTKLMPPPTVITPNGSGARPSVFLDDG